MNQIRRQRALSSVLFVLGRALTPTRAGDHHRDESVRIIRRAICAGANATSGGPHADIEHRMRRVESRDVV
jgi:hypothetical protein